MSPEPIRNKVILSRSSCGVALSKLIRQQPGGLELFRSCKCLVSDWLERQSRSNDVMVDFCARVQKSTRSHRALGPRPEAAVLSPAVQLQ